jgi:hypothetical protein
MEALIKWNKTHININFPIDMISSIFFFKCIYYEICLLFIGKIYPFLFLC